MCALCDITRRTLCFNAHFVKAEEIKDGLFSFFFWRVHRQDRGPDYWSEALKGRVLQNMGPLT